MFIITERQYNIILQQAISCFPQESGGILGGRENTILGVLPIPNQHLYDKTETFALTHDDLDRGFTFLSKHGLEFLGIYHSHPKGAPQPSAQDLSHGMKYHFIICLRDQYNPELYAWRYENGRIFQENIRVISDFGVTVIDIHTGKPKLSENMTRDEMLKLASLIDGWISGRSPEYKKLFSHKWSASSFSTFA